MEGRELATSRGQAPADALEFRDEIRIEISLEAPDRKIHLVSVLPSVEDAAILLIRCGIPEFLLGRPPVALEHLEEGSSNGHAEHLVVEEFRELRRSWDGLSAELRRAAWPPPAVEVVTTPGDDQQAPAPESSEDVVPMRGQIRSWAQDRGRRGQTVTPDQAAAQFNITKARAKAQLTALYDKGAGCLKRVKPGVYRAV